MTLQELTIDGVEGWRWGDDGTFFTGREAQRMALREGAKLDPRVFAQLESVYGYVVSGEEVDWDVAEGSEVLHLD